MKPTRRSFFRRVLRGTATLAGLGVAGVGYGYLEASQIRVRRETIALPNLSASFQGKTIAVIGDFHHGPLVGIDFIRNAVALAQSLNADAYALVGDFAHQGTKTAEQIGPCFDAVSILKAPLGVFAVPGNHDMGEGGRIYRQQILETPLTDLTNTSMRLKLGTESLWLAGVDDHWWGKPDLNLALKGVPDGAAVVLLAHNPDFAEEKPDARVGLVLSGHTHGGQASIPGLKPTWMPSKYGEKYRAGLVQGPASKVFITRGIGETTVPLRFNCPPEINLLTLIAEG